MLFFKILTMLWPFIKEAVLGEKTVLEAFKTNKKKVIGIALIVASFGLNYFTVSKIIAISRDHIALVKDYKALEGSKQSPITNGVEVKKEVPIPAVPPPNNNKVASTSQENARHARLKAHLDAIRAREERDE